MTYSSQDYNSVDAPFFLKDSKYSNINFSNKNNFQNLIDEVNFPLIIKEWFLQKCAINQETYFKEWTFFSLNFIIKRNKIYNENNINIIDLGFTYLGLGWIQVAFYDPKINKIVIRKDGGSNDYDRIENFNKLKTYDFNNNESSYFIISSYNFDDFLKII